MFLKKVGVGVYYTNCYIAADELTKEAFVIDPAGDFEVIDEILVSNNLNLKYIILTHGHFDHIGAVKELKEKYNSIIYINEFDAYMVNDSEANLSSRMKDKIEFLPDKIFKDGDILKVGSLTLRLIHTPGHTEGSSCVLVGNILFAGDTLFKNSIGRTDLPSGDRFKIISSIKEKLLVLPKETLVYPGHGPSTTINNEIIKNPFF